MSIASTYVARANVSLHSAITDKVVGGSLGLQQASFKSMHLGDWRNQISDKLMPRFFNNLSKYSANKKISNYSNYLFDSKSVKTNKRFSVPVFSENMLSVFTRDTNLHFSFATENFQASSLLMEQMQFDYNATAGYKSSKIKSKVIEQEFFTPGYVITNGKSSIGLAAVLVQQRFLDDSYGSATYSSSSSFQPYSDKTLINTNRGTGYRLNFSQALPANINFTLNYQSQIEMNEFDSFGSSYSEPGDFDIPSQYTFSLEMPLTEKNKISVAAEKISYSSIKPSVHSGYSQSFLNVFNGPISPLFKLEDLTVYSLGFEQALNHAFSWNIELTTRQQAPATALIFNNILKDDTASVSYKIGLTQSLHLGEFSLYTSFANKPILIGYTEFGRLSSNSSLGHHIEGVATWSFQF